MNQLLKRLTKYIVVLTISSLVSYLWIYVRPVFYGMSMDFNLVDQIPNILGLLVQVFVAALLFLETRRMKLPLTYLTLMAAFIYPLLGIVVFSVNFITHEKETASAKNP